MSDFDQYTGSFAPAMKITVVIPMATVEVFRDNAIIHEIAEDLVSLQLSRDELPMGVAIHVGQVLEIRGGKDGSAYSCRGILVSEGDERRLLLRLIGDVVTDEMREFYRIDAFLPVKYYLSPEQNSDTLRKDWTTRSMKRKADELNKKNRPWDSSFVTGKANLPPEPLQEHADIDTSWDTIIPLAANISGGGIRMITHSNLSVGEFAPLEILVPEPRHIVDVVARVVFANSNHAADADPESFTIGMQFVFIHERDRDAIVNYISTIQQKRMRQLREGYLFREDDQETDASDEPETQGTSFDWLLYLKRTVFTIIFFAIVAAIGMYFVRYSQNRPKGEIEQVFEGGLKKYLEKIKK